MIWEAILDLEGFGGWTGASGILGLTSSFGTSTDSIKAIPQFWQNLSSGLTFPPHFGQKFTIILISFDRFSTLSQFYFKCPVAKFGIVSACTKRFQTFSLILPNLIHQSKKMDLKH